MGKDVGLHNARSKSNGRILDISEVERGLKCNCCCIECGSDLVAKKKDIQHHFAHASGEGCSANNMTVLHKIAQEVISSSESLIFPKYLVRKKGRGPDGIERYGNGVASREQKIVFDEAEQEGSFCDRLFKADVLAYSGSSIYVLEVLVTNECTDDRVEYMRANNISCLELNLKDVNRKANWKDVVSYVNNPKNWMWISHPEYEAALTLARADLREKNSIKLKYAMSGKEVLHVSEAQIPYGDIYKCGCGEALSLVKGVFLHSPDAGCSGNDLALIKQKAFKVIERLGAITIPTFVFESRTLFGVKPSYKLVKVSEKAHCKFDEFEYSHLGLLAKKGKKSILLDVALLHLYEPDEAGDFSGEPPQLLLNLVGMADTPLTDSRLEKIVSNDESWRWFNHPKYDEYKSKATEEARKIHKINLAKEALIEEKRVEKLKQQKAWVKGKLDQILIEWLQHLDEFLLVPGRWKDEIEVLKKRYQNDFKKIDSFQKDHHVVFWTGIDEVGKKAIETLEKKRFSALTTKYVDELVLENTYPDSLMWDYKFNECRISFGGMYGLEDTVTEIMMVKGGIPRKSKLKKTVRRLSEEEFAGEKSERDGYLERLEKLPKAGFRDWKDYIAIDSYRGFSLAKSRVSIKLTLDGKELSFEKVADSKIPLKVGQVLVLGGVNYVVNRFVPDDKKAILNVQLVSRDT